MGKDGKKGSVVMMEARGTGQTGSLSDGNTRMGELEELRSRGREGLGGDDGACQGGRRGGETRI